MTTLSKFHNPLDDFSTYSVHYVMLACRTTEEARVFIEEASNTETLAAISNTQRLGDSISYKGTKDVAYLVMDTRRFSQFSIDRLKYEVLINGIEKEGSHGNLATTIEMTILDSVGISFINFLQWLMDSKMQCNFDGMIFMLRTIFVGHTPDGKTKTVQTLTIPMHLFKLEVNLDYSKGAYTAEFMPNINFDAQRHNRWLNISQATSYFTGKGDNTLGSLIDSFEKALNDRSEAFYNKASSLLKETKKVQGKYGRLVKYMITLPDGGKNGKDWNAFKVQGWGTNSATETVFTKIPDAVVSGIAEKDGTAAQAARREEAAKSGKPVDTHISVETGMQITQVLDVIFKQVPEISALGTRSAASNKANAISFYKYLIGITSNDEHVVVHVDVVPFNVPDVILDQSKTVSQGDQDFYREISPGVKVPKDYIEFDYIFTGKNKDILNFDMKIQDLQWMLAANLDMGAGVMTEESEKGQGSTKFVPNSQAELVTARPYDPILLPRNTAAELENFSHFASLTQRSAQGDEIRSQQQEYTRNLSAFYAASPITTNITIRGNPNIMLKFSTNDFMPHPENGSGNNSGATFDKKKYRKQLSERIIKDNTDAVNGQSVERIREEGGVFVVNSLSKSSYTTNPVFVKINVKGPNVDFLTNEMISGQDFTTEILQNNYYVVMKVTNLIEGGNFTQDLELYSHNVFGRGKIQAPPNKEVKSKA